MNDVPSAVRLSCVYWSRQPCVTCCVWRVNFCVRESGLLRAGTELSHDLLHVERELQANICNADILEGKITPESMPDVIEPRNE